MSTRSWIARLVILATCLSFALIAAGSAQAQASDAIVSLDLDGVVDPFIADYVRGAIQDANDDGSPAILLTIDTPGGLASSMREITQAILNSKVPVICYVAPEGARAASAGAFVLMSCPVAAMAPGTNVGAATPVSQAAFATAGAVSGVAFAAARIERLDDHANGRR
jgi:membrane-bound serine protease (ClpP class)